MVSSVGPCSVWLDGAAGVEVEGVVREEWVGCGEVGEAGAKDPVDRSFGWTCMHGRCPLTR